MPRPWLRLRLRTLMVIVVLVAAPIGIAVESKRQQLRDRYLAQARAYAEAAEAEESLARYTERRTDFKAVTRRVEALGIEPAPMIPVSSEAPIHRRLAEWHRLMERKYRRAARVPWLPIEADPPMPK